jgi:hypothetical protein
MVSSEKGSEKQAVLNIVLQERHLVYASMAFSIIALIVASVALYAPHTSTTYIYRNTTQIINGSTASNTAVGLTKYRINSSQLIPQSVLSDAPIVTQNQSFGNRLTGINSPLGTSDLAVINNAPNSYFETAGEMYLNRTLNNSVGANPVSVPAFIVNGKPSVIYLGTITCIFCGENKWSMALALSRFGNFSQLFAGYSALKDGDVPTLFWAPAHYNKTSAVLGSFYNSKYINFLPIEESASITGGFSLMPLSSLQFIANQSGNLAYIDALKYISALNGYQGTPFTIWGNYSVSGADAVAFGDAPPTNNILPLTYMTHAQLLQMLAHPASQLAWTEYAGADIYVAMICKSIGNVAPVCNLPAIRNMASTSGS